MSQFAQLYKGFYSDTGSKDVPVKVSRNKYELNSELNASTIIVWIDDDNQERASLVENLTKLQKIQLVCGYIGAEYSGYARNQLYFTQIAGPLVTKYEAPILMGLLAYNIGEDGIVDANPHPSLPYWGVFKCSVDIEAFCIAAPFRQMQIGKTFWTRLEKYIAKFIKQQTDSMRLGLIHEININFSLESAFDPNVSQETLHRVNQDNAVQLLGGPLKFWSSVGFVFRRLVMNSPYMDKNANFLVSDLQDVSTLIEI